MLSSTLAQPAPMRDASPAAWYALAVLTLVTLFGYVDRGIFVLLAEPIRLKLGLSDLQLGLLQGTGVALFAALASFPLGWLADRFDRRVVLAGCLVFWSAAVVACGLAQNFAQLLVAGALVGAGEAGLVPIVYSLIPDLFRDRKRQLANSVFALASTASGALALALCGQVIAGVESFRPLLPAGMEALDGWRLSFFAAALPAPVMVLLIATIAVQRGHRAAATGPAGESSAAAADGSSRVHALIPYLKQHAQTFFSFHVGVGFAVFGFSAVGAWLAVIYMRVYGQTSAQVGAAMGATALVATALGFAISVYGVRYFAAVGVKLNVRALWTACLITVATDLALVFTTSPQQMYAIQGLHTVLLTAASMLYPTALQSLAPSHLRARVVAIQSVVGLAFGALAPPSVGLLSDQLKHLPNGIIVAAVGVAVPAMLISAALLFWCERGYEQTVEAGRRADEAMP